MDPIRKILVPVDFDPPSEAALQQAVRFARAVGAKIKLLHVLPFALSNVSEGLFYEAPNTSGRMRAAAAEKLAELAERFGAQVPIETDIVEGIAWDEIVGAAKNFEADMIVLGTHGRQGVARGLLGSVAERVVRSASVPVMTVRADVAHEPRSEFAPR
jgi:nucleotide-binding universal stress UspA family protein